MYISLISPLSLEECVFRLESIKKPGRKTFWGVYQPLRCDLSRISDAAYFFNLRKRISPHAIFVIGKLYRVDEGTSISYEVSDPSIPDDLEDEAAEKMIIARRKLRSFFTTPIFLFFLIFILYAGVNIFHINISIGALIGIFSVTVLLGFIFRLPQQDKDEKELVEFLYKTFNAVTKSP